MVSLFYLDFEGEMNHLVGEAKNKYWGSKQKVGPCPGIVGDGIRC